LPNPDARELASLLVRKAEGDEAILGRVLDDPDVPDDVLGFHVQQAIEKRLKAVLAFHEVDFDRTHSIGYLTSLLEHHGIELPGDREQIENLTPWAVVARYQSSVEEVLDRAAAREQMSAVRDWSRRLLGEDREQDETPSS
jgi:HEPN domain-containing protein